MNGLATYRHDLYYIQWPARIASPVSGNLITIAIEEKIISYNNGKKTI